MRLRQGLGSTRESHNYCKDYGAVVLRHILK